MCSPFDPAQCVELIRRALPDPATEVVTGAMNQGLAAALTGLTEQLHAGIKFLSLVLAGWILVPSTSLCPDTGADIVAACTTGSSPAEQIRGWLLPVTALVAVIGIVWQGITMAITRKGEPLLAVLKGLFATGLWGVVGVAGTQLALRAGDGYASWILRQAIFGDSLNPTKDLGDAIASMSADASITAVLVLLLLQIPFFLATLAQILLMIFREGAVVILAGQLQLAAAGGFTRLTSGWLAKVTGWMLALIAYKPVAATIYATAFALMGDGVRNLVMGLAVMVLALIALPALMRLFNWSVGSVGHGSGNALGMLGTSLAAGLHGASALRGLGGYGAVDHARWLDTHGPNTGTGPAPDSGAGAKGPGRPGPDLPRNGPRPAAGGTAFPIGTPATGQSSTAATRATTASGTAGAAAATGGVTLAAEAAVQAGRQAKDEVHRAADTVTDAMDGAS